MTGPIVTIDDPQDPRIAPYVAVRERDLAGRCGDFIAEGDVVVRTLSAVQDRCPARSLLVARRRLERVKDLIDAFPISVPIYVAEQRVMDAVVGFPIHRGLLAHARRPREVSVSEFFARPAERTIILVALGVSNHDNMGGLFRNSAAFGVDAVLIDADCCDPLYRKAIRVSVGAALKVPFARIARDQDPIGLLEGAGLTPVALSAGAKDDLRDVRWPARTALLVGAEGPGLPAQVLARVQAVSIPMAPGWDSLNVAAASAVALFCATAGRGV